MRSPPSATAVRCHRRNPDGHRRLRPRGQGATAWCEPWPLALPHPAGREDGGYRQDASQGVLDGEGGGGGGDGLSARPWHTRSARRRGPAHAFEPARVCQRCAVPTCGLPRAPAGWRCGTTGHVTRRRRLTRRCTCPEGEVTVRCPAVCDRRQPSPHPQIARSGAAQAINRRASSAAAPLRRCRSRASARSRGRRPARCAACEAA